MQIFSERKMPLYVLRSHVELTPWDLPWEQSCGREMRSWQFPGNRMIHWKKSLESENPKDPWQNMGLLIHRWIFWKMGSLIMRESERQPAAGQN